MKHLIKTLDERKDCPPTFMTWIISIGDYEYFLGYYYLCKRWAS